MEFEIELFAHIIIWTEGLVESLPEGDSAGLFDCLRDAIDRSGCTCLAMKGTGNHLHLLVRFITTTVLDVFVEDLKTQSREWMNQQGSLTGGFHWSEDQAIFTVSECDLADLKKYISSQKSYHRRVGFREELIGFLTEHEIEFEEDTLFPPAAPA